MPLPQHRRWTRAEVVALIDANPRHTPRYELVDGALLVTPAPSRSHQRIVAELLTTLNNYLKVQSRGRALTLTSPADVALEADSLVQPDVFVTPRARAEQVGPDGFDTLLLVVEVLSPSSKRIDRGRKRLLYQRHVPEYWIADLDARSIERWRPGDVDPEVLTDRITWHPAGATQPLVIDIAALYADALDD